MYKSFSDESIALQHGLQTVSPKVFGLEVSPLDVAGVAEHLARRDDDKVGHARLFVTANIQHISEMRDNRSLRSVLEGADLLTCDGFPVAKYARLRGCDIAGRVTGREVVDELMHRTDLDASHRLFFLVDGQETADAVMRWSAEEGSHLSVEVEIAPMGFGNDDAYCTALAQRISDFETSLLFLGVGAPRSEIFAMRYRHLLPECWVLCIGQSIKIALGLVTMPPAAVVSLKIEWLWRMALEPKRLFRRYSKGAVGFTLAVMGDLWVGALHPGGYSRRPM